MDGIQVIGRLAIVAAIPYILGSYVAFAMLPDQELMHKGQFGRVAQALLPQWLSAYRGAKLAGGSQAAAVAFVVLASVAARFRDAVPAGMLSLLGPAIVMGAFLVGWLVYQCMPQPTAR